VFKLAIIQDYIPAYRAEFFKKLRIRLLNEDIDLRLLASSPSGVQRARGDFIEMDFLDDFPQWHLHFANRAAVIPKRTFKYRNYDALIGPLRGSSFATHSMILHCKLSNKPFGLWGHVGNYVNPGNFLDIYIEKWQMRLASAIFAYTQSGMQFGIRQGIKQEKFFVLNNTFDLTELETAIRQVSDLDLVEIKKRFQLSSKKTLLYIGGLDSSKRIDFLVDSLDIIWVADPKIKLLVIGDGVDRPLFADAIARGQVHILDNKGQHSKAIASKLAEFILMPGRIGLVAVDSIAMQIPILTTDFAYHAPEFDYLVEGKSKYTSTQNSPSSYAELVLKLLSEKSSLSFKQDAPSIDEMVDSFIKGVMRLVRV
jgi:glycosyltransferase involved in cell wall biosynthesis